MRKLTHPLGPVKGGKLQPSQKLPGRTQTVPHAAQAGAQQADAAGAVKALQTPVQLSKLAALASNTIQRTPISGR